MSVESRFVRTMSGEMARHREKTSGVLWALPSLMVPLAVTAIAWTSHVASEGKVIAPNVRFAGNDVSGLSVDTAAGQVGAREIDFLQTEVTIDLGDRQVAISARETGYDYLFDETVRALVGARHDGTPWGEVMGWLTTPFRTIIVEDRYQLDLTAARSLLEGDEFAIEDPIEPSLENEAGVGLRVLPGKPGVGIDIDATLRLLETAPVHRGPVTIEPPEVTIPPTVSDEQAGEMAHALNARTEAGLLTVVGDMTARLTPNQIRRHVRSHVSDGVMSAMIDIGTFQAEIEAIFPEPVEPLVPPTFGVVDGVVAVIAPGEEPLVCCTSESIAAAAADLVADEDGAALIRLEPRLANDPDQRAWAEGSNVTEVVGEFTTHHGCCESRVTNIHRMADLLTGVYLLPGDTLSLNEYIGPRTRENGFVDAGAIRQGHMVSEVGGGVSQFVTTLFNAAYFAGLDFDEYQSHSIYFSRYPFGREATISMPGPDLVMTNSTDYPVLIWPTYDATSITVTMYSTAHVEVAEVDQRVSRRQQCTHVETDRRRIFPDGRVVVDTIEANYRPAEGIDCFGRAIPDPEG
jgi:vancomycin resistance protein YoaR